jgi:hypothetical protein
VEEAAVYLWADREQRGGGGANEDLGPGITLKDIPPLTYFFQLGPNSLSFHHPEK